MGFEDGAGRAARVARNELIFRAVNERIGKLGDADSPVEIVCECENAECFERIELPREEIATIENDHRHFFIVPGHEAPDVERVVERREHYFVVEKPEEALRLAKE
jgi:hypothetical protein